MTQIIIITVAALLIFFGAGYRKEQLDKKAYEEKLKKDNVDTEKEACKTHNKIGKIVKEGKGQFKRFL